MKAIIKQYKIFDRKVTDPFLGRGPEYILSHDLNRAKGPTLEIVQVLDQAKSHMLAMYCLVRSNRLVEDSNSSKFWTFKKSHN